MLFLVRPRGVLLSFVRGRRPPAAPRSAPLSCGLALPAPAPPPPCPPSPPDQASAPSGSLPPAGFAVPLGPAAVRDLFRSEILQRRPGLWPLLGVPPVVAWDTLVVLRRWLSYLNSHAGRWTASSRPSCPLLLNGGLVCIWQDFDTVPPVSAPVGCTWSYLPDGSGVLHLTAVALSPAPSAVSAWLLACPCIRCGRPCPLRGTVALPGPGVLAYASPAGSCCWFAAPESGLTGAMAERSAVSFLGSGLRGVLSTGWPRPSRRPPPSPYVWGVGPGFSFSPPCRAYVLPHRPWSARSPGRTAPRVAAHRGLGDRGRFGCPPPAPMSSRPVPAPTGFLRGVQCSAPLPVALPDLLAAAFRSAYTPAGARPRVDLGEASVLRVLSINCGGAVGGPARLTALLVYADPDVVCLQEAASLPQSLGPDLLYRRWCGPPIRGGGLVTLVHRRMLPVKAKAVCLFDSPACLCVTVELSGGAALSVVNLHLPPGTSAAARRGICPPPCSPPPGRCVPPCPRLPGRPAPPCVPAFPVYPGCAPPPLALSPPLPPSFLRAWPSIGGGVRGLPPLAVHQRGAGVFWRSATTGGAGLASS